MSPDSSMQTFGSDELKVSGDKASDLRAFTARLARFHDLSDDDQVAIGLLPWHEAVVPAGKDFVWAGERVGRCAVILDGMAFSYKVTREGRRQVLGLHLAGDVPDLQSLCLGRTDASVAAANRCRVGFVPHAALSELCAQRPSLAEVLWRETLSQAALIREWLLNVGRRDALGRLAHLMCEVVWRHRAVGLTSDHRCSFPLNQAVLADALGLSVVHINRRLQDLRGQELVDLKRQRLTVLSWERLSVVADFDPGYLHVDREPPAFLDGDPGANFKAPFP